MTRHLKLTFITFLFSFLVINLHSQEWIRQHPNLDIKQMNDISVGTDDYGWAVGNGMVYFTSDAGENWLKQEAGLPPYNWNFIFYVEGSGGQKGFLSNGGSLYRTNDAGVTWAAVMLGEYTTSTKEMMVFSGGELLLMGSNKILRSTDDGENWNLVLEPPANLTSMTFPIGQTGWASSADGTIYSSTDGGANWAAIDNLPFTDKVQISFVNNNLGFACEGKNIFRSEDGGQSWSLISENALSSFPNDFKAGGESNLYATKGFRINYSTDGGVTWEYTGGVSYAYNMEKIHTLPDGRAWVGGSYGAVIYTEDPVQSWADQLDGVKDKLFFIKFFDGQTGLAGGGDWALLKTIDGGQTWQDITFPHDEFENLKDALLLSDQSYLVAGRGTIFKTTDGGSNWDEVLSGIGNYMSKLVQTPSGTIFASSENTNIYRSQDEGQNWTISYEGTGSNWINSIYFIDDFIGFASGRDGTLLKTEDGGESWGNQDSGTDKKLLDIAFFDANTGLVALDNWSDSLLYTQDGGLNWTTIGMPGTAIYRNFCFLNETKGYVTAAAAFSGGIYKTEDAGQTWELIRSTSLGIHDLEYYFDGEFDHLWASGDGGLVEYWTNMVVGTNNRSFTKQAIDIFPNPSDGLHLTINWPENISDEVNLNCYNVYGQQIFTKTLNTDFSIVPLPGQLVQGNYFITITDVQNKTVYTHKLVVVN